MQGFWLQASGMGLFYTGMGLFYIRVNVKALVTGSITKWSQSCNDCGCGAFERHGCFQIEGSQHFFHVSEQSGSANTLVIAKPALWEDQKLIGGSSFYGNGAHAHTHAHAHAHTHAHAHAHANLFKTISSYGLST
jgi:hypothetical protein